MRIITLFMLLPAILFAGTIADFEADSTKGKSDFTYIIKPPKNNTLSLDVIIDPIYLKEPDKEPAIDILLLIDNTGSMGNIINMIKTQIDDISSFLLQSYPNVRIGVASIAEHSSQKEHDAYRIIQNFTADSALLKKNIATLHIDDQQNSDIEEPYLYGLSRSLELEWREEGQKILFFIGDAWAREPDEGLDKTGNTQDDLYTKLLLDEYRNKQIQICSYYVDEKRKAKTFFSTLSEETNGFLQPIKNNSDVKNDFKAIVTNMVGLNYDVNAPFNTHVNIIQNANRFRFNFDLNSIDLATHNHITVHYTYNNSTIAKVNIRVVPGKPWGVLIVTALLLLLIFALGALRFIYRNIYMTTVMDYAFLRHYAIALIALLGYGGVVYFIWGLMDSPDFPILWRGFWW